ncbi:hypothetical protein LSH36_222g04007 [Paralvinella palmiformis]|uniref:SUEL-type lectin domain-containing protein n=1 Tax=Paralvinella palmiformis TaxID=53620 RepID=A0AAD9N3T1_9ANNE|nr:hypothetical protein LSH36_222g04007 [Paralvinella palmiformis]
MELLSVILFYLFAIMYASANAGPEEVCVSESFHGSCPDRNVIVMQSALYGRMKLGRCMEVDLGYLGCENDVLFLADRWCSGHQKCTITVPNEDLLAANIECNIRGLSPYLELNYECVTVSRPTSTSCSTPTRVQIHGDEGYLSSHVTAETGCGSPRTPWLFQLSAGQRLKFRLVDFGALSRQENSLGLSCQEQLGFIVERNLGSNFTICGDRERERDIYNSKTNIVELSLISSQGFIIKYNVLGCSDLTPPANAWYKREGNEAVIGCKSNDKIWRLYCNGNTWDGVVGNCSYSKVIFLTCVVCGALLLIIIVVVAGAVYVKKQSIRHELRLRSEYASLTLASTQYLPVKLPGYDVTMTRPTHAQHNEDNQPLVEISERTSTLSKVTPGMRTIEDNQCTTLPGGRQSNRSKFGFMTSPYPCSLFYHKRWRRHIGKRYSGFTQRNEVTVSASFGRMKLGRCIEVDVGYMGCENDVLFLADRWCSGHRKCTIIVPNEDLQVANTECNIRGLSPYLELNYECVIVIGCSDLKPPAHAWYKREGNEAVIGCEVNDRIWRLYCNGNTWVGVVGNCSNTEDTYLFMLMPTYYENPLDFVVDKKDKKPYGVALPFSSVIFLTCVVCSALLLIIIVVVAGAVYVKKQSIRHELRLRSEYASLTLASTQYLPVKLPGYDVTMTRPTHAQHNEDNQPLVEISERTSTLSKVTPGMRTIEDNQCTTLPGGRQSNVI